MPRSTSVTHRPARIVLPVALLALLLALLLVLLPAGSASAHTDFESSSPADGEVVETPVDEIVLTFTAAAEPTDDGFQVLAPDGMLRAPTTVVVEEDRIFRLGFEPSLAGGTVGVRWNVRSSDTHQIAGSFTFTVTAPAPTTTPPTTDAPTTTAPPATAPPAGDDPATTAVEAAPADTQSPSTVTEGEDSAATPLSADDPAAPAATTLDEFLAVDEPEGDGLASAGRLVTFFGVIVGLGALAFTAAVLVGRRAEVIGALRSIRVLGAIVAIGAVLEYVGVSRLVEESMGSTWSTQAGFATVLRLVGGVAIAVGIRSLVSDTRRPAGTPAPSPSSLSAAVIEDAAVDGTRTATPRWRWSGARASWPASLGVVAILMSFWFDGHTVTTGFRPLHAISSSVHVAAASVWAGGVVTLAVLAWWRHRNGDALRFGELVVRFSTLATVSLVAVAAAGSLMTVFVLDSPGDLTSTEWGQVLLLKLVTVAAATGLGAYNHFVLRPRLDGDPDDPGLNLAVRNTLTAEAILLLFVVVVTSALVAASAV